MANVGVYTVGFDQVMAQPDGAVGMLDTDKKMTPPCIVSLSVAALAICVSQSGLVLLSLHHLSGASRYGQGSRAARHVLGDGTAVARAALLRYARLV